MQRSKKYLILYLIIAIAAMLLFSVRTSPVYSLQLGDYGNNAAATGMLIGKYWLRGAIPYKDLFAMGSPLYFLIQAAGWGIAERIGILALQVLNYFIFLIFMRKVLLHFCSEKAANLLGALSALLYIALCCGGDSAVEWCLSLHAVLLFFALWKVGSVKKNRMKFLLMGLLCGAVFMIEPMSGGMAYGVMIFSLISVCRQENWKNSRIYNWKRNISYVFSFILGAVILCIPFIIYFAVNGCLKDMFQAMLLYPFRGMLLEAEPVVVVHKIVKCVLAVPLLVAGIYSYIASKRNAGSFSADENDVSVRAFYSESDLAGFQDPRMGSGILMIVCAVCQIVFLLLCRNDWHYYLIHIPGIMTALAVFVSVSGKKKRVFLTAGTIVVTAGICFSPLKNYCDYLIDGVTEVAEEFLTDLKSFQTQNEQCKMLFLDTDSTWYLLIDQKPQYRYFTEQTDLASWDEKIAEEKDSYLAMENDVIISTEHGWTGQDFENYTLIQVYLKKQGNICIYIPNEE